MHHNQIRVVLTGGGSGGHIIPLLSLAHALKKTQPNVYLIYIGWKGDDGSALADDAELFDEIHSITAGKFRRYSNENWLKKVTDIKTIALNARDLSRVVAGRRAAAKILKKAKPSVVFSKGGFVAVPVGLAAAKLKIPIVTHDSDAVPGLANRIIGKYAAVHAVGQKNGSYNYPSGQVVFTGVPISGQLKSLSADDLRKKKSELGLPARAQLLVISGGGLGAERLNKMAVNILPRLLSGYPNLYITHITGAKHEKAIREAYKLDAADAERLTLFGFTRSYDDYVSAADLVVCRAGATTIAELAVLQKPVVLVPAAQLADSHQVANAHGLAASGAARVINDNSPDYAFLKVISELLDDEAARRKLSANLGQYAVPGAATELARIIIKAAAGK